jgi:hypothetical protein
MKLIYPTECGNENACGNEVLIPLKISGISIIYRMGLNNYFNKLKSAKIMMLYILHDSWTNEPSSSTSLVEICLVFKTTGAHKRIRNIHFYIQTLYSSYVELHNSLKYSVGVY